jgi:hypothetical protein
MGVSFCSRIVGLVFKLLIAKFCLDFDNLNVHEPFGYIWSPSSTLNLFLSPSWAVWSCVVNAFVGVDSFIFSAWSSHCHTTLGSTYNWRLGKDELQQNVVICKGYREKGWRFIFRYKKGMVLLISFFYPQLFAICTHFLLFLLFSHLVYYIIFS